MYSITPKRLSGTSAISKARAELTDAVSERFSAAEKRVLERSVELAEQSHAGQLRGTGEPYVCHPLKVAQIVADWQLDPDTIVAAVLHDLLEDTPVSSADLRKEFGEKVTGLVEALTKLGTVRVPKDESAYDSEELRRVLLAMAKDVRVVLLKLADRLHNVLTIKGIRPAKRERFARETLEIYAPLADRLGMGEVRSTLEDQGFRYADPKEYAWTKRQVQATYGKRERYIAVVKRQFEDTLKAENIPAEISARTKNLHSLYRKLLQKERDIDKIYDLFAIRVIVDSVEDCYRSMGLIHANWQPLPHRIKDYIAVPKLNGYRSLHTTIFGPQERLLEVQFRTRRMHEEAELGVAAHAFYAEAKESVSAADRDLALMKQLASWQEELEESDEVVDRFKLDMFVDRIFAFTPKGAVHSLPAGATPVDFAYTVHTEVGHMCRGAKVNGVIVPLDAPLANGDVVEVLTSKQQTPKRDWLGFVRTGHARSSIRAWFRSESREDDETKGRQLVDAWLKKGERPAFAKLPVAERDAIVAAVPQAHSAEDALAKVGAGSVTIARIERVLDPPKRAARKRPAPRRALGVTLSGASGLATKFAKCCVPRKPVKIVGYVTVGKGISIHRADCSQVRRHGNSQRLTAVNWQ